MMRGTVQGRRAAVVLPVFGEDGSDIEIEFVLDTGFTGLITLPSDLCLSLGLPLLRTQRAGLADGSSILLRVYAVTLLWDEHERAVEALAIDSEPFIGMTLLDGYDVFLRARNGGFFTIKPSREDE